jgi:uncharacterized protein (DUF4415 family)
MYGCDDAKNAINITKHGVSFTLAQRIFDGPVLIGRDERKDYGEPRNAKGDAMKKPYDKSMTAAEIAAITDRDIDFSDVPQLDDAFWQNASLVAPDRTQSVTLRVKKSVLEAYKAQGKGYQTRMNAVLESYARTLQKHH